ncbi:MAG TPA: pirin family protein, partial [Tepidisphaeraceae bacterium]|nr:pirin family protein [Tepidisphaeraceae bacterium]
VIKSEDRYHADHGWLDTRWHFSFSDYYDEENMNWGPLRVFNDDVIKGGGGFGAHPHRDMEIVTYVIEGVLEHQDNLGHTAQLKAGEVQMMSAGSGIVHAEYNPSKTDPVHLLQLWIMPRTKDLAPRWDQRPYDLASRTGKLLPVISSGDVPNTMPIDQDATIYVSHLKPGTSVTHKAAPKRLAYLFVINGAVDVNGTSLNAGDQARIADETELKLSARDESEIILLDLPA